MVNYDYMTIEEFNSYDQLWDYVLIIYDDHYSILSYDGFQSIWNINFVF